MRIILDVNIILSALIKDSTTRKLIITSDQEFYFPEISLQKIRKYQKYIQEKASLSEYEFFKLFSFLIKYINVIPNEELIPNWGEAKEIMHAIDPEDVVIIASALSQEECIIWSDDKHFEKQSRIPALKTKQILKLFGNSPQ